jgi:hypothetical protein
LRTTGKAMEQHSLPARRHRQGCGHPHGRDSGPSRACDARCPSDHGQSGARLFPAYGS